MAEETFQRVIPRGTRLRQLLDVEIPGNPSDGSLLLWDAAQGRWVARQLTVPAHTHVPAEISPQGAGSGLDADLLDGQHASAFASAFHSHPDATTTAAGFMSAADKSKLDGIQAGAEVNQNAFSNVKVGTTTIVATTKTDTVELVAGSNVTLTPDATNKRVTIAASGGSSANSFGVVQVGSTNVAATAPGDTVKLAAGSNVTLTPDATNKQVTVAVSPQGSGSGLHADLLDSYHAGNASGQIPVSNGTVCTNLNADMVDGLHASALQNQNAFSNVKVGTTTIAASATTDTLTLASGSNISLSADTTTKTVTVAVSPQGSGSSLHADLLDGYHAGNAASQIPVSNGTPCTNLNADLVDGYHASSFLLTSGGSINGNLSVSGYVTIGNRPLLIRGKKTSQSIAASTTTVVSFPDAVSLTGAGSWNATTNVYTVGLGGALPRGRSGLPQWC
ncbi:hypothetical protein OO015_00515 [Thermomicrobium sp. 4228-Ro]|uniref:hypothetical protein n=1 Tax=Thermomicrobium sp. 4228-Ro TaxID=2993937 RepID=UPI0022491C36|nr:hypothetical protein [Thermomicrobium sp. 4228-Ro]MCX2725990.1 hypothetical protein [Thermomicrobium sp. 4228-Ro]